MNTREQLKNLLEENTGEFVSGNTIAASLGVTRAAVWKSIQQLQEDGYEIEAVTNRGYRLGDTNDVLSDTSIRRYLGVHADLFHLEVHKEISSTNNVLKVRALEVPEWYTIIADSQSQGKGRQARAFFSPPGTGIYLSTIIKSRFSAVQGTRITIAAAVAICRAIEQCCDSIPQIKWVNDVYINEKKICGILTEASISMESGGLEWAVMGIGLNVYEPDGGFPDNIAHIAGSIVKTRQRDFRSRLAAAFLISFYSLINNLQDPEIVREYRNRSFLVGRRIQVIKGEKHVDAVAEEVDDECQLVVRYEDGRRETLSSGEVSIRV